MVHIQCYLDHDFGKMSFNGGQQNLLLDMVMTKTDLQRRR